VFGTLEGRLDRDVGVWQDLREAIGVTFEGWRISVAELELMHDPASSDLRARQLGSFEVSLSYSVRLAFRVGGGGWGVCRVQGSSGASKGAGLLGSFAVSS